MAQAMNIEPIDYDMNSSFPYNNYIYLITLSSPTATAIPIKAHLSQSSASQPATVALPANATPLIVRPANPDPRTGSNNTNRIENEVAFYESCPTSTCKDQIQSHCPRGIRLGKHSYWTRIHSTAVYVEPILISVQESHSRG